MSSTKRRGRGVSPKSQETKLAILDAGVKLWPHVKPREIARQIKMTHPVISYHFPDDILQDEVAKHAVATGCSKVIAQLIATNHKAIRKMPEAERLKHLKAVR